VAILSFEDRTSDPNDGHWSEGIKGLLTRQFRHVKAIRLLSDTAIRYAFQKNGLEYGSAVDVNQARAIGETIEAQRWSGPVQQRQGHIAGGPAGPERGYRQGL